MLLTKFSIKNVEFRNRVLRSSIGGRMAYYDGTVSPAFVHFDRRFAENEVGGIISPTISINEKRMSPQEYPCLHDDRFVEPLRQAIRDIKAGNGCRYIVQLGDTGAHAHTSLVRQPEDRISASPFFDPLYGYVNTSVAMTEAQIDELVEDFARAAKRAVDAGADGLEITASKGYIIHQFLNPATNRRKDRYGGTPEKRFQLLKEVVERVRDRIGSNFLFGIRISARDYNYLPFPNPRIPWPPFVWPPRDWYFGNDLPQMIEYAQKLKELKVDYLHVSAGFGFPNPKEGPGDFPEEGLHGFVNAIRYIGGKANARAVLYNSLPRAVRKAILGIGWRQNEGANAEDAGKIRAAVGLPVIANGGFQKRSVINNALEQHCDAVAIARPLLANPDLVKQFRLDEKLDEPKRRCSFCSLCCAKTAFFPMGCWDKRRFKSENHMINQIYAISSPNAPFNLEGEPL